MKKPSIIKRLVLEAKPIWARIAFSTVISLISVLAGLVSPLLMGKVIDLVDRYLQGVNVGMVVTLDMNLVLQYCLILLSCYVVSVVLSATKMYLLNTTVSRHFTATLRMKLSEKIKRMPISYIDNTPNGEIISRMMGDVSVMGNTIHNFMDLVIVGVLQLVAIAIIMIFISWSIGLIVIAVVPVCLIFAVILAHRSEKLYDKMQEQGGKMYAKVEENLTNFATVKCYNMEQIQNKKVSAIVEEVTKNSTKADFLAETVSPIISFTNNICFVIICLLGGTLAIKGEVSIGDLVAVIAYSKQLSAPLGSISNALSMLQRTQASAKRVYELMDKDEMTVMEIDKELNGDGAVTFENVNFSYTDKPLITDLNLQLHCGNKIAIVGPTGAGKTTIVNLLMRFYDIDSGRILIDGEDIGKIKRERVREAFSMVLQDTWIFNGTIIDNIRYSNPSATDEQVMDACRAAYCDGFISSLPNGYQTILADDMTMLSAGQKQLLTLARAFLSQGKILILDEATSNIDTRTELLIQKAMDALMKGRTCFVIAHRLSTIVNSDLILVLNEGTVVEKGTHSELMKCDGFYASIYNSQYALIK